MFEGAEIGERIAQARKEAGLTQEELADVMGVSTRSLQGYEAGEVIPYRHFERLSGIVQRPVEWILHGDQTPPEPATVEEIREARKELAEMRETSLRIEQMLRSLLERDGPPAHSERP